MKNAAGLLQLYVSLIFKLLIDPYFKWHFIIELSSPKSYISFKEWPIGGSFNSRVRSYDPNVTYIRLESTVWGLDGSLPCLCLVKLSSSERLYKTVWGLINKENVQTKPFLLRPARCSAAAAVRETGQHRSAQPLTAYIETRGEEEQQQTSIRKTEGGGGGEGVLSHLTKIFFLRLK